jgi:hypothetical protein
MVAENEKDEVLLGRPLLQALGLDVPTHLDAGRESFKDLESSKILSPSSTVKPSKLLLRRQAGVLEPMRASSDLPTLVGVPVGQVPFGMDELESAIKWDAASYKQKDRLCLTETAKLASARISDSVTYGDMDTDPVEFRNF